MSTSYFNPLQAAMKLAAAPAPHSSDELPLVVSIFNNERDNAPQQRTMTWSELRRRYFQKHTVLKAKGGLTFSPVSYRSGSKRGIAGVEVVYCAVFDVEHHGPFEDIEPKLAGYTYIAHSSHSHTSADPRFRIIMPLATPVRAEDWGLVWATLNQWLCGINDQSTKDASRIYYLPSKPPGAEGHFLQSCDGKPLVVEELPELSAAQQANTALPAASRAPRIQIEGIEVLPPDQSPAVGLERIVARCKFMAEVSQPDAQPNVTRPLWMAMVSNAARFEDSDDWIHEASRHHDKYDESQTANLIESCRNFEGGPITCQRIKADGYGGCPEGGCKTAAGNVTKAPAGLWMNPPSDNGRGPRAKYKIGSFEVSDRGVHEIQYKDGEEFKILISSRIDVLAQTRASGQSEWGYLLSIRDPNGQCNQWHLPRSMLTNKQLFQAELLRRGASIYSTGDKLYSYLMACDEVADRAVSVSQPGWAEDVDGQRIFMMPGQIVHSGPTEVKALLQNDDPEGRAAFAQAGSMSEWQAQVAGPASGNSRLTFAVSVALTGPLLSLLNVEGCGFHYVGESSSGKTTAVEVAASVWGGPKFVQQWRATSNALESIASRHNDTLLVLDEINQVGAEEVGEIAYMLGNGRGKARAARDALARPVSTWKLMFLSTGEKSLSEHMQSSNAQTMAGQEVRMVSFPAGAGQGFGVFENLHSHSRPQAFADYFKKTCKHVFGSAGVAWINAILECDLAELTAEVWAAITSFESANVPAEAAPQVGRVARRFAIVAAAGEAAIRRGILPWQVGEASNGARACFRSWLADRGGVENQEERQAVVQIRRFLEQHGESRFTAWDDVSDAPGVVRTVNRVGFRRVSDDGRTDYLVLTEAYKTELCNRLNPKEVTRVLRERGLLMLGSDGGNTRHERLPGLGPTRVYRIKADIFNLEVE